MMIDHRDFVNHANFYFSRALKAKGMKFACGSQNSGEGFAARVLRRAKFVREAHGTGIAGSRQIFDKRGRYLQNGRARHASGRGDLKRAFEASV